MNSLEVFETLDACTPGQGGNVYHLGSGLVAKINRIEPPQDDLKLRLAISDERTGEVNKLPEMVMARLGESRAVSQFTDHHIPPLTTPTCVFAEIARAVDSSEPLCAADGYDWLFSRDRALEAEPPAGFSVVAIQRFISELRVSATRPR